MEITKLQNGNTENVQPIPDKNTDEKANKKPIRKKETADSFDKLIEQYSKGNEEVKRLLGEWLKVRKAKRAAMTDYAIESNLKKLERLAKESKMSVTEYIDEIIRRGWQAFYAITTYAKNDEKKYGENGIAIKQEKSELAKEIENLF